MTDTHWKLVWVAVAAALYVVATLFPGAEAALHTLAGVVAGGAVIKAPGHGRPSDTKYV